MAIYISWLEYSFYKCEVNKKKLYKNQLILKCLKKY